MAVLSSDICKIIFAIILPPLGVFLERGCGVDLLINIPLTILGKLKKAQPNLPLPSLGTRDRQAPVIAHSSPLDLPRWPAVASAFQSHPRPFHGPFSCHSYQRPTATQSLTNAPRRLTGFIPGLIHALYIIFKY